MANLASLTPLLQRMGTDERYPSSDLDSNPAVATLSLQQRKALLAPGR